MAVEGLVDAAAATRLVRTAGHDVDPARIVVTRGKTTLDLRLPSLNRAARHLPWLVLRDADRDVGDCPLALRASLLTQPQEPLLCLRLAVRSLESWLLADAAALTSHFRVSAGRVPVAPEAELDAKRTLVRLCSASQSRSVRQGMARDDGERPGREYSALLTEFARDAWDPRRAAERAPSLARAMSDITARFV